MTEQEIREIVRKAQAETTEVIKQEKEIAPKAETPGNLDVIAKEKVDKYIRAEIAKAGLVPETKKSPQRFGDQFNIDDVMSTPEFKVELMDRYDLNPLSFHGKMAMTSAGVLTPCHPSGVGRSSSR